jgi:hypothetical protein
MGTGVADAWKVASGAKLKAFLDQYTAGFDLYYWHPTYEERLAALASVGADAQDASGVAAAPPAWEL